MVAGLREMRCTFDRWLKLGIPERQSFSAIGHDRSWLKRKKFHRAYHETFRTEVSLPVLARNGIVGELRNLPGLIC
jgi:hypothetical protein